jgi:Chaperone of endosialidase
MKITIPSVLAILYLVCVGPLAKVDAVSPPPDGGYPNQNTAEGEDALFGVTSGAFNTALGFRALHNDTTGGSNTAVGAQALTHNTIGINNTATGKGALFSNVDGGGNVANGLGALFMNTSGAINVAVGFETLFDNTTGRQNTAVGTSALLFNSTGNNNNAIGYRALTMNTTGSFNIAIGSNAGYDLTTGHNNIDIGNRGVAGESDTIRIGKQDRQRKTYIAGIYGAAVAGGVAVVADNEGQLGTMTSSARFKQNIKPMEKASNGILSLRPVTFHYKSDTRETPQFGLVAEEVAKVNPALVLPDKEGKPYTVRYDAVNAMLLNEFLKEHLTVQDQGAMIAQQQKEIKALKEELKEQASQIQKVSAQLQLRKPETQTALNNP